MTTHINSKLDGYPAASAAGTTAIVPIHVAEASNTDGPDCAALAVSRLKAFVAAEGPSLKRLLSLIGLTNAQVDLNALRKLLVRPADRRRALKRAERLLDLLVEDLAEIPVGVETQRPLLPGEEAIVRDLDAWVRWHGARAQEMRSLVRHTLR